MSHLVQFQCIICLIHFGLYVVFVSYSTFLKPALILLGLEIP